MRPACELSGEAIAGRFVKLMHGGTGPSPILERYADCLEKAAELDDLSLVRVGRQAESFEAAFRFFVTEFPGAPAVTVPEGEFLDMSIYLARVEPELRQKILRRWAETIRAKA